MGTAIAKLGPRQNMTENRSAELIKQGGDILENFVDEEDKRHERNKASKELIRKTGFSGKQIRQDERRPFSFIKKWLVNNRESISQTDPPEELAKSTLYIFQVNWQIRILSINLCRSRVYCSLLDLVILAFYIRMTIFHFQEKIPPKYDAFGIAVGCLMFIDFLLHSVAYGLIGHRNSFLLRSPFNWIIFLLTFCYFVPSLHFLQVLQCFRIFNLIDQCSLTQSFAKKTKIIKLSLVSLTLFAAVYMLLVFLFSLFSWLMFYDTMSKYCIEQTNPTFLDRVLGFNQATDL